MKLHCGSDQLLVLSSRHILEKEPPLHTELITTYRGKNGHELEEELVWLWLLEVQVH